MVSLLLSQPVFEAPVKLEPTPEPLEAVCDPPQEPQVDPRIEQHRLELPELAFKRAVHAAAVPEVTSSFQYRIE